MAEQANGVLPQVENSLEIANKAQQDLKDIDVESLGDSEGSVIHHAGSQRAHVYQGRYESARHDSSRFRYAA